MTWQVLITVFTLGGIGAMIRGGVTMILASSARIFPMSILIVNVLAAFLGGFILSLNLPEGLNAALAIGLVGGIGTLSSVPGNLLDLFFDKAYRRLALYLGITIFGGVLSAQAGISMGNFVVNVIQGPQQMQNQMMLDTLKQQESYLESLRSSEHIDYDNLPSLREQPEETEQSNEEHSSEISREIGADSLTQEAQDTLKQSQQLMDAVKRQEQVLEQIKDGTLLQQEQGQEQESSSSIEREGTQGV